MPVSSLMISDIHLKLNNNNNKKKTLEKLLQYYCSRNG